MQSCDLLHQLRLLRAQMCADLRPVLDPVIFEIEDRAVDEIINGDDERTAA